MRRHAGIVIAAAAFVLSGCATEHALMPTPALYTGANARPLFGDSPVGGQRPVLDLLYVTDRAPAERNGDLPYTAERSRSIAFGSTMIEFGQNLSWKELLEQSTAPQRPNRLNVALGRDDGARPLSRDTVRSRCRFGRNHARAERC